MLLTLANWLGIFRCPISNHQAKREENHELWPYTVVNATPVLSGDGSLPGVLADRVPKAAKVTTTTLRVPLGALVIAGVRNRGLLNTAFDLMHLPADLAEIFIMVGAGVDQFPPGYSATGVGSDPILATWQKGNLDHPDPGQFGWHLSLPRRCAT